MLSTTRVQAMTYVPMSDEALLQQSEIVVTGRITDAAAVAGRELDQTDYTLAVDDVIKGAVTAASVHIRLPGAIDPFLPGALIIPGIPRFSQDQKVLVFLRKMDDGNYGVTQLALGRFSYAETTDKESIWERDLADANVMDGSSDPYNRYHRNAQRFVTWLKERSAQRPGDNAYWSTAGALIRSKYELSTPLGRWFEFDRGQTVPIYAGADGQDGLSSGGCPELQTAINAWNNDSGSNILLSYQGLTSALGGLGTPDGISTVLFNDPNNLIDGLFNCLEGGIGALGQWRGSGRATYKGQTYIPISEGDIVVQDGIGCLLDDRRKNNGAELLAHELGHVLGLAHSCGDGLLVSCEPGTLEDGALMRPTLHADGRGATLNADDRAAVAFLYGNASTPGGGVVIPTPEAAAASSSSGGGAISTYVLLMLLLLASLRGLMGCAPFNLTGFQASAPR